MKAFLSAASFRKKFVFSYLILLLLFLALMFHFVANSVQNIVFHSMNKSADEIISKLAKAQDEVGLIQTVKSQRPFIFYRIAILDDKQQVLYDSHIRSLVKPLFFPLKDASYPEVKQALEHGTGYAEEFSQLLDQKLIYLAKSFQFQGRTYVLRIAFPHEYIQELRHNFKLGFALFSSVILILFSVMTGLVVNRLTHPIEQIIEAIKPYQQGKIPHISEIVLKRDSQDEFSQLASTLNSLSERVKSHIQSLTNERNEKEAILEALGEGVLAVDQEMCISYANSMAISFLGLDKSPAGQFFPKTAHPKLFELLERCRSSSQVVNDAIEISLYDKKCYLNVVASPRASRAYPKERHRGVILILQDKSIHYKILQMRQNFIANASHELKTPITIIRGFAEMLEDNPDLPKETIADIVNKIVKNCHRMTKIIRNLLTLADIENLPSSRLATCDLLDLTKTCKNTLLSLYPHVHVSMNYEVDRRYDLFADSDLLEVAIMNLLDNAAKYSKQDPEIAISIEKIPSYIQLRISDNGIGIPKQDLENVFQRFYRVNKTESKKHGGSGLGLSIVETIVEKHFGKVYAESVLGQGSTFTVLIADDVEKRTVPNS